VRSEGAVLVFFFLEGCATAPDKLEASLPRERIADYREFVQNCQKCHGLERALDAHVDNPEHWDLYVARMMRTPGSGIHPREAPGILRFLHYYTEQRKRAKGGATP
jgi:hypothetical protein